MRIRRVSPLKIHVPDVRMTSQFDLEEFRELVDSIRAQGILTPLKATVEGERLVLVDGLNRLRAALELKLERVPVIVEEGDLSKNLVQNVVTNRMRGRSDPAQLVLVIKALQEELGLEADEIEEKIGLSHGYTRQLLRVAQGSPMLLQAIGERRVPLGVAVELARIPGFDNQESMLAICEQGRFTITDAHRAAESMIGNLGRPPADQVPLEQLPLRKAQCTVCQAFKDPIAFEAPLVCRNCWGALLTLWGASTSPRTADVLRAENQ